MASALVVRRGWRGARLVALFATFGCGDAAATAPEDERITGMLVFGFETQSLEPCHSAERWWVVAPGDIGGELVIRYLETITHEYEPVYVELSGTTSELGEYGHLGAYDREFLPTAIVNVRPAEPGDCGA